MAFILSLPSLSGPIELGISGIKGDASLSDYKKLPILLVEETSRKNAPHNMIKQNALFWAFNKFSDSNAQKLFLNGIAAILDFGLVRKIETSTDGDWYVTHTKEKGRLADVVQIVTVEEMNKAITVVIATKVNFWLTNHHTGQETVAGYLKKVLDKFYENQVTDQVVSAAHSLGHFTSTLGVLSIAGIPNIRDTEPITKMEGSNLVLSQDDKLRFQSMPAGTHMLGIAYELAKRLVRSSYGQYCPNVMDFAILPELRKTVMKNPAKYHVRAFYLIGAAKEDDINADMENYLGRLGTFITTMYKHSTLAKSPCMAINRIENYIDYDVGFKHLLIKIQQVQALNRGRIIKTEIRQVAAVPEQQLRSLQAAFKK